MRTWLYIVTGKEWTMSDMVKYRAVSFKKDKIAALYFTMSDIVYECVEISTFLEEKIDLGELGCVILFCVVALNNSFGTLGRVLKISDTD